MVLRLDPRAPKPPISLTPLYPHGLRRYPVDKVIDRLQSEYWPLIEFMLDVYPGVQQAGFRVDEFGVCPLKNSRCNGRHLGFVVETLDEYRTFHNCYLDNPAGLIERVRFTYGFDERLARQVQGGFKPGVG